MLMWEYRQNNPQPHLVGCDDHICFAEVLDICVPIASVVDLHSKGARLGKPSNLRLPLTDGHGGKYDKRSLMGYVTRKSFKKKKKAFKRYRQRNTSARST